MIDESTRLQIDIKKKIRYADKIQEQNQWQYLSKAYDDLKWYESQNAENSSLVTRIKQETNKISGDLQRYDDFERQKTKKVDSTPYVGSWYYSLQLQTQQLETSLKTATTSSNSSYVRIQTMLRMIQSMRYYPNEIHYSAEQLSLGMTHKNINDWLKRRRETAQTSSQQKQADLVSSFLQNNNKFIIDFDSEFSELQRELYTLQSQSNGQYISDETTKNLNQILRKIDRKYQDNYQIFNSAVLNFVQ